MQVGSPWRHPNVRPDLTVDLFFAVPGNLSTLGRYKLMSNAPIRIRYVRVDYQGIDHRYITNRDVTLQPGEEYGIEVPFPPRGGAVNRFKLGVDAPGGTEVRLFVMVPR